MLLVPLPLYRVITDKANYLQQTWSDSHLNGRIKRLFSNGVKVMFFDTVRCSVLTFKGHQQRPPCDLDPVAQDDPAGGMAFHKNILIHFFSHYLIICEKSIQKSQGVCLKHHVFSSGSFEPHGKCHKCLSTTPVSFESLWSKRKDT